MAALQFKQGHLLANLSKIHKISQPILSNQIQALIGRKTYYKILQRRKHNPSNKILASTIKAAATQLEQGAKVIDLCRQFNIHRKTLRRRLRRLLGNKYDQIIQGRRKPEKLIQELAQQFLNGESLSQLSKQSGIPLSTIHRRLPKTIGEDHYREIMRERLLHPAFGTRGAARSKYEAEIENLLIENNIPFIKMVIEIEGHKYQPDFILLTSPPIIIEATGMNIDSYWIKYKHKLQHYLGIGYLAIFIVPDASVYNKARKYIHERNVLIKLKEFKNKINSLKKAPDGTASLNNRDDSFAFREASLHSCLCLDARRMDHLMAHSLLPVPLNKHPIGNMNSEAPELEENIEAKGNTSKEKQADLKLYIPDWETDASRKGRGIYYYYEGLPPSVAKRITTGSPNIDPDDTENESPTAKEMIEIAEKHSGLLIGYVVMRPKNDRRIAVTGFEIEVDDKTARELKKELAKREIGPDEFIRVRGRKSIVWRFWWD